MVSKRAPHPRDIGFTKDFEKDWERLSRTGRFDMNRLKRVMSLLFLNDSHLGAEWRDHPLKGNWVGHRECHIGGDFLLIYVLDNDAGRHGMIIFTRLGTHSELFRE